MLLVDHQSVSPLNDRLAVVEALLRGDEEREAGSGGGGVYSVCAWP